MKKNITINLCGRLFAIDEDAYEMLSTYEQSLRNYFRTREGGEEIAEDIEARIAELLDEVKQGGTEAITIEHVREIIHRIGRPDEMEEDSLDSTREGGEHSGSNKNNNAQASPSPDKEEPRGLSAKRLYRDPNDKKMMGVLSGFAAYFGGDVLWWRLGYAGVVLLSFMGSSYNFFWFVPDLWGITLIVAYIVLAILMPVAETPEDRLRMKGKEVNPQNLAEEIANSSTIPAPACEGGSGHFSNAEGYATAQTQSAAFPHSEGQGGGSALSGFLGCIGGFFVAFWTVVTTLFRWCIYAWGAFVAVMCLVGIICLTAFAANPCELLWKGDRFFQTAEFKALIPELATPFYAFVVAVGIVLAITAYAIIHSLLNEFKQMPSMPYRQRIALLLIWIAGLVVASASIGYGLPKVINAAEQYHQRHYTEVLLNPIDTQILES